MDRRGFLLTSVVVTLLALVAVIPVSAQSYISHTVQPGESLSKIAARYCTAWDEIYNINRHLIGDNPDVIEPGLILNVLNRCGGSGIYDHGPRNGAAGSVVGNVYTVAPGDTLFSIGLRFGVSVSALQRANQLQDAHKIFAGQRLLIPGYPTIVQPPVQPPVPPAQPPVVNFAPGECTVNGSANAPLFQFPNGPVMGYVGPAGATFNVVRATRVNGELWFELPGEMETPGGWIRNADAPFNQDICQV